MNGGKEEKKKIRVKAEYGSESLKDIMKRIIRHTMS